MMRPREQSEGVVGKGLKRKMVEQRGERCLLYSLKTAAARARTLPDMADAKPRRADCTTKITFLIDTVDFRVRKAHLPVRSWGPFL